MSSASPSALGAPRVQARPLPHPLPLPPCRYGSLPSTPSASESPLLLLCSDSSPSFPDSSPTRLIDGDRGALIPVLCRPRLAAAPPPPVMPSLKIPRLSFAASLETRPPPRSSRSRPPPEGRRTCCCLPAWLSVLLLPNPHLLLNDPTRRPTSRNGR